MHRIVYGGIIVFCAGFLITGWLHANAGEVDTRSETAEVVSVISYEDRFSHLITDVYAETEDGNVFVVRTDGFAKGDTVLISFDTKGTEEIEDDAILDIRRYCY